MSSIYLLLLALLVLFSWVGSVYGLVLPDGTLVPSLLSETSLRWFVRHSLDNVSAAPIAEVLLILLVVGSLRDSGLWYALWHRSQLVPRQRHARFLALVILAVCSMLVLLGVVPGGNLLSVTGHWSGGPIASGWLPLLSLVLVVPSMVYGKMCEHWNSPREVCAGLSSAIASYADYFVTLVVASQLVAAIHYVRLFPLIGLSPTMQHLCIGLIYYVPILLLFVTHISSHEFSESE